MTKALEMAKQHQAWANSSTKRSMFPGTDESMEGGSIDNMQSQHGTSNLLNVAALDYVDETGVGGS